MQLSEFNLIDLREAIAIYITLAYGDRTPRTDAYQLDYSAPDFESSASLNPAFTRGSFSSSKTCWL